MSITSCQLIISCYVTRLLHVSLFPAAGQGVSLWDLSCSVSFDCTVHQFACAGSTCVDEASRCALAELFGFVGQRDLHHPGNVSGWSLHTNGMGRDQLQRGQKDL